LLSILQHNEILKSTIQNSKSKINTMGSWFSVILCAICIFQHALLEAAQDLSCLHRTRPSDALLITAPDGSILYKKNETIKCIPASTLKILTALSAIHHLGLSYRFPTEFYTDIDQNLKIKGYGDPLLTSEVWQQIADVLATKIRKFNTLILDNSYFSKDLIIPGTGRSTNPYDAPPGALCANFNTILFDHDQHGTVISAEPQTPMTPFAREKIRSLGLKKGRYTFTHNQSDATRYTGEIFLHFLMKGGVKSQGKIRLGTVKPDDRLFHTYLSGFTLNDVITKMMTFSNNFVANQLCIVMGAHVYGPPGTLENGVSVISDYAKYKMHLKDISVVEGSGISRKNRISALEMNTLLDQFKPHRHLLKREGDTFFKTGTLEGIRTRVGYIEKSPGSTYSFVVFLNSGNSDMDSLMGCIKKTVANHHFPDNR
jgi:D-alanyl-D-alanine carboxypeptidase/D-alanyl-D-alanine-endopeptidase (penicillin-binding protein 4)